MQNTVCTEIKNGVFREYLISKGIKICDYFEDGKVSLQDISQEKINKQLGILKEFHNRAAGYTGYSRERIKTCTGKNIEKYKIDVKRAQKDLKCMKTGVEKDSFGEFLLESMDKNINRAERCLKLIYENGYINLIMRSMKKREICIGSSSFDNIRFTDAIEVINLEDCSFNMVENDAVYLLRKIKNKGTRVDYNNAVEEFLRLEGLDEESKIYILSLLTYPHEFMKYYSRFREKKKGLTSLEWERKFAKAMMMDGESLI